MFSYVNVSLYINQTVVFWTLLVCSLHTSGAHQVTKRPKSGGAFIGLTSTLISQFSSTTFPLTIVYLFTKQAIHIDENSCLHYEWYSSLEHSWYLVIFIQTLQRIFRKLWEVLFCCHQKTEIWKHEHYLPYDVFPLDATNSYTSGLWEIIIELIKHMNVCISFFFFRYIEPAAIT